MSDINISLKDNNNIVRNFLAKDNGDGTVNFYHTEDATQRAALVAALAGLATATGQNTTNAVMSSLLSNSSLLATTALQTSGNTILGTIATNTGTIATNTAGLATSALQTAGAANIVSAINNSAASTRSITAATLPLPVGASVSAKQDIANTSLASIDSKLTSPLAVTGPLTAAQLTAAGVATAALQSAGNASLATLVTNMTGGATTAKQDAGNAILTTIAGNTGGLATSTLQSAANTTLSAIANSLSTTLPVSVSAFPLPTGAATDATLNAILTKLGTARAETLWTDDTNAFFVRVDNAGSITWTDVSGVTSAAPATGARPAAGASIILDKSSFQATTTGTGYSAGDYIDHILTTDPKSGAVIGQFWLNLTTSAKLASAPPSSDISPSSSLGAGAATSSNQIAGNTSLSSIDSKMSSGITVTGPLTSTQLNAAGLATSAQLPATLGAKTSVGSLSVVFASDGPQATGAKQDTGNASLASIANALSTTLPVSAAALPLPTGAATDATLNAILNKLGTARAETLWTDDSNAFFVRVDNAGSISWTNISGVASSAPSTGARPAAGSSVILDKTNFQAIANGNGYSTGDYVDHLVTTDPQSGIVLGQFWLNVSTSSKLASAPASSDIAPSSSLGAGAATSTNQITGNSTLSSINSALAGTLAVSLASAPLPAGAATSTAQTTTNNTLNSINSAITGTLAVSAASLPLPSGAATAANQSTGNVNLASIDSKLSGTLTVAGPLTSTQLNAAGLATAVQLPASLGSKLGTNSLSVVLASDSGHATSALQTAGNTSLSAIQSSLAGTLAVSTSSLPLPAGAATSAAQASGNSSLTAIQNALSGTLTVTGPLTAAQLTTAGLATAAQLPASLGAKSSAASVSVVLANDGTQSTAAKQDTGNTSLAAIASSVAGTLAVSAAALPLPTGAATGAKQDTGNASLSAIATSLSGTLPVSATALPLPNGAATDATLNAILTKLGTARAETLWTDDSNAFYVRVDAGGTITWTTASGGASSGPGTGARPAAGASVLLDKGSYQATVAGTGYSVGDFLDHMVTLDPTSGAVIGHFWININTESVISAPVAANVAPLSPLAANAATAAAQTTGNTSLATIATNTTNIATSALQTTGNTSLATIATNTAGLATATAQGTGNTSLATIATNTAGLATATAQSAGNTSLATIATNSGNAATSALQSTGNTALASIVTNTAALATATAQTAGNTSLASIVTNTTGIATAANQATMITALQTLATNSSDTTPVQVVSTTLATAANQTTMNTSLTAIQGSLAGTLAVSGPLTSTQLTAAALATAAQFPTTLGAKTAANSLAVTLSSDGTYYTMQTAAQTSLSSIVTNTTGLATSAQLPASVGAKASAASLAVTLATDGIYYNMQTAAQASLTTIATNSGTAATAALQTTGNGSLATIATNSGNAATSALQTAGNTSLASIVSNTAGLATAAGITAVLSAVQALASSSNYALITPSDSVALTANTRAITVGGGGNLTVKTPGGVQVGPIPVVAGQTLAIAASYIMATGTSATSILAQY